jgi:hypothetical protein
MAGLNKSKILIAVTKQSKEDQTSLSNNICANYYAVCDWLELLSSTA